MKKEKNEPLLHKWSSAITSLNSAEKMTNDEEGLFYWKSWHKDQGVDVLDHIMDCLLYQSHSTEQQLWRPWSQADKIVLVQTSVCKIVFADHVHRAPVERRLLVITNSVLFN